MEKTIQIVIAGIPFSIEESAYPRLAQYLDSIKKYFSSYEDSHEITADIEARIAEKFLKKTENGGVIGLEDVNNIVKSMGSVSDFEAENEDNVTSSSKPASEKPKSDSRTQENYSTNFFRDEKRKALGGVLAGLAYHYNFDVVWARILFILLSIGFMDHGFGGILIVAYLICWMVFPKKENLEEKAGVKKFYRLPENKVLGGVATGLSSYLGMDLVIVRVIFVVLGFAGIGVLIYIIFWIVAPNATTLTQRMELKGQPVTIENIESTIKTQSVQSTPKEENAFTKLFLFPFRIIGIVIKALGSIMSPLGSVMRVLAGILLLILGGAFAITALMLLGVYLGLWQNQPGVYPREIFHMITSDIPFVGGVFAFLVIFVPAIALIIAGISLITGKGQGQRSFWLTILAVWFAGLVGMSTVGVKYGLNFAEHYSYRQKVDLIRPTNILYLTIDKNEVSDDMDDFYATDVQLKTSPDNLINVDKEFYAKGRSNRIAESNARNIMYNIYQKDSVLYFPEELVIVGKRLNRSQRVNAQLNLPVGQRFKVSKAFAERLWNNSWDVFSDYGIETDNVEKYTFVMKANDEVVCEGCPKLSKEEKEALRDRDFKGGFGFADFENLGVNRKVVNVGSFENLEIGHAFVTEIKYGTEQKIELYSDDKKYLDDIQVKVEGNTLKFDFEDPFENHDGKINIRITCPVLKSVNVSGAAQAKIVNFENNSVFNVGISGASKVALSLKTDKLNIEESGASSLICKGSANQVVAHLSGASDLDAKDLKVQKANVGASGSSSADFGKVSDFKSETSGSAEVNRE